MNRGPIAPIPVRPNSPPSQKNKSLPTTGVKALPVNEVDVDRHGGEQAPTQAVPKPQVGSIFKLDQAVIDGMKQPETLRSQKDVLMAK